MSDTKYKVALTAPAPATEDLIPGGIKTYVTLAAGFIAMTVLPALHSKFPWIPALDVDSATAILSLFVFLALAFMRNGLKSTAQFVLSQLGPVLMPEIERVVRGVIQQEIANLPANSGIDATALSKALDDIVSSGATPLDVQQKAAIVTKLAAPGAK